MHISKVKMAFKIADVKQTATTRLNFAYLNPLYNEKGALLPQSFLRDNLVRVYLIVVNDEIKKIGGSYDKGGIKGTLKIYQTGGVGGRPSIRSYGIWYFLYHQIVDKKAKVEFYLIYQENFVAEVKGLFGYHTLNNAALNYKLMEECCLNDYKTIEGSYPAWNMQEDGKDWPAEIKQNHAGLTNSSLKNKTKKGRKEGLM